MDEEEKNSICCSCKSTCSRKMTPKNGNRGCRCKTEGVACGNKCTCNTKKPCKNKVIPAQKKYFSSQKKIPTVDRTDASGVSHDNNNNFSEALGVQSDREGVRIIVHHHISSIQQEPSTSTKRTASEAFTSKDVVMVKEEDEDEETAYKRIKLEEVSAGENYSEAANKEFFADVVFALDYSSSVSEAELNKEVNFVEHLAKSWNVFPGYSKAAVVVYGDNSVTAIPFGSDDVKLFSDEICELKTKTLIQSKGRRMDLALTEAARDLQELKIKRIQNQHQLVVLITAGKQLLNLKEEGEEENDRLLSAAELLSSNNIKVVIVPVGLETDFKQLGLIVKRPQSLFPHSGFDDLTPLQAYKIALYIEKTIDVDMYAKEKLYTFSEISPGSGLWEKITLCSDVMEGAWYLLYDDQKKQKGPEKVKSLIRESIDNFHSTLVSDSKICISLAVFGPLGAGKSFFLNFLLNHDLCEEYKVENGPLPSACEESQTPIPIYVKYGKKVQVLLLKQKKCVSPVVLFPKEELGNDTLKRVNGLLKKKFQESGSLSDANCIELQGPFPVFRILKKRAMTTYGHLELEVDVQLIDVPGRGDKIGNDSINSVLNKADVVLFFQEGQSGRPISSEDIAQIFRRREEYEFTSRPKLVHVVNDRRESSVVSSCDFDLLQKRKRGDLNSAWSSFFSSSVEDEITSGCYTEVRAKLPQLNGEVLLDTLSKESEVIYFHPENSGFLESLKVVINDHVQNVKIKEMIHPFLQNVHWAAKTLRKRIGQSLSTEKKRNKAGKVEVKEGLAPRFELHRDADKVSDLMCNFMDQTQLPLQKDINGLYDFLYNEFLNTVQTLAFLLDSLKVSLENFSRRQIDAFTNANWSTAQDVPGDVIDLVELLCRSRVQQFCANSAPAYVLHVLGKVKNRNPFGKDKRRWSSASEEEKKELCVKFLSILLERSIESLMKETRDKQYKKSHFHLIAQLKQDVKDLLAVRCSEDDSSRSELLKLLNKNVRIVIDFCTKSIREINPHPSLDVQADISLPERMTDAHEGDTVPLQPNHEKLMKDMIDLLVKSSTKGADVIRKLETKLNLGKGALVLPKLQNAEQQRLWAKAVVNVLSDKDHFDISLSALAPSLILDPCDPEVEKLLNEARKRVFAHQKSFVTCDIVNGQAPPDNEIHLRKSSQKGYCIEVLVSSKMRKDLDAIRNTFVDPMQQIAPIFMPTIRPGPTVDIRGNFFLEEDPWSKDVRSDELVEEEDERSDQEVAKECKTNVLDLNIFLVVEKRHLGTIQSTVDDLELPAGRNIKLTYVVLPQNGRGIGVTRAIIKSLAECLNFSLYWTIDDDVQFMYQFDGNDRRWHKCSLARGLLFGQRAFQTCLEKTVKELSPDERHDLFEDVTANWPRDAKKTRRSALSLLIDSNSFAEVQKNPGLLHTPFKNISDCGGDAVNEEEMKACERDFVNDCRKRIFEDAINHIAGISLAHESTKGNDYMSKYPSADYMRSEQRHQVVLHNTCALKGINFVSDEVIFHEEEFQICDQDKRNTPYWGIKGKEKSFCRALTVGGVIGYQVIRVIHSHKKLTNVVDRVGPSYIGSQSPYRSEDEGEEGIYANP